MQEVDVIDLINEMIAPLKEEIAYLKEALKCKDELNEKLINEMLKSEKKIENKDNNDVEIKNEKILLEYHGNSLKISGNTYKYKTILREHGGSWNKSLQSWIFKKSCKDFLIEKLEENNIEYSHDLP